MSATSKRRAKRKRAREHQQADEAVRRLRTLDEGKRFDFQLHIDDGKGNYIPVKDLSMLPSGKHKIAVQTPTPAEHFEMDLQMTPESSEDLNAWMAKVFGR